MNETEFLRWDQRMRNWGRWAGAGGGGGRGCCASAERYYLPPKLGDGEQAIHRTVMTLDVPDAELVERAVCSIQIRPVKRFLIDNYVRCYDRLRICRRIRLDDNLLESFHRRALATVADQVAAHEVVLIRRGKLLWAGLA